MKIKRLSNKIISIDGSSYRVHDEVPTDLSELDKTVAYKIYEDCVFPYKGKLKVKKRKDIKNLEPGLYLNGKSLMLVPPKSKDSSIYSEKNVRDLSDVNILKLTKFKPAIGNSAMSGDAYKPPFFPDDDKNNTIMKVALTIKEMPIRAYDERIKDLPLGVSVNNRISNTLRAFEKNTSLSNSKLGQYCVPFDLDYAVVLRNTDDALHPMPFDSIVIYNNEPFDISGSVDVNSIRELWDVSSPDYKSRSLEDDDEE